MTLSLRLATESDAESIAGLLTELGYPTNPGEAWRRLAGVRRDPASRVLVAVDEAGIVGCLSALLVPHFPDGTTICRITSVVVAKAHRRKGVGATLLEGAHEFAKQRRGPLRVLVNDVDAWHGAQGSFSTCLARK